MQCACALLPFVACPALPYFSTLSHERHDFQKNVIEFKLWFPLQFFSEPFLSLRRIQRDAMTTVHRPSCEAPFILVRSQKNLKFSRKIFEKLKYQVSRKSVQWGPVPCGRTDRQTDSHDEAVNFRNSEKQLKYSSSSLNLVSKFCTGYPDRSVVFFLSPFFPIRGQYTE
jgi:hypothetical protein